MDKSKLKKRPRAIINDKQAKKIRDLYKRKVFDQYELAEIYQVSQPQINRVINSENWKGKENGRTKARI